MHDLKGKELKEYLHKGRALKNLKEKRGWISKIPENKKVVILLSGGFDSLSTIAQSIIEFDISIYPLFINRSQTNINMEELS